jgi:hypothetical protein
MAKYDSLRKDPDDEMPGRERQEGGVPGEGSAVEGAAKGSDAAAPLAPAPTTASEADGRPSAPDASAASGTIAAEAPAVADASAAAGAPVIVCPRCGAPMVLRTAKRGARAGKQFFGCSNYPHCRGIVNLGE